MQWTDPGLFLGLVSLPKELLVALGTNSLWMSWNVLGDKNALDCGDVSALERCTYSFSVISRELNRLKIHLAQLQGLMWTTMVALFLFFFFLHFDGPLETKVCCFKGVFSALNLVIHCWDMRCSPDYWINEGWYLNTNWNGSSGCILGELPPRGGNCSMMEVVVPIDSAISQSPGWASLFSHWIENGNQRTDIEPLTKILPYSWGEKTMLSNLVP